MWEKLLELLKNNSVSEAMEVMTIMQPDQFELAVEIHTGEMLGVIQPSILILHLAIVVLHVHTIANLVVTLKGVLIYPLYYLYCCCLYHM